LIILCRVYSVYWVWYSERGAVLYVGHQRKSVSYTKPRPYTNPNSSFVYEFSTSVYETKSI
jgi:hypothetical protein